jgi:hypothetical protein
VIGAAHTISKTGQAAYGEFIIVARTAAELAQMHTTKLCRKEGWLRWFRFHRHECCLNNKRHDYEKERTEFISATDETRPTQV